MMAGLTKHSFFRAMLMLTKRLYLLIMLFAIGCQESGLAQDKVVVQPISVNSSSAEALSKQLKVNRDVLFSKGSSEQVRIDIATLMLFSEEAEARKILVEALKQMENKAARISVCRTLSQTRVSKNDKDIQNKSDFIEPLLVVLTTEDADGAKPAAEALLIFEYSEISNQLEKIVNDRSLSTSARVNAISALELQPNMEAIFKLLKLLDDPNQQVVSASEKALESLGIPTGRNAAERRQIMAELERKGPDEFLRDLLIQKEKKTRELKTELDELQKLYLDLLDKQYGGINADEAARGKFLSEYLASSKSFLRLWSLDKVSQWLKGTSPRLPSELGPVLVNLISDPDREVRFKTATLMSLMSDLDSSAKLLEQIKAEKQDEQLRTELFTALGWSCYYGSSVDSKIKVSPEIRKEALSLAREYLNSPQGENAQKGAAVMKKLLERDGLSQEEVDEYLGLFVIRYAQEQDTSGSLLGVELLGAMADLCGQSVYKEKASKLYEPIFVSSLLDERASVREGAVKGLIYIDSTMALNRFRKQMVNDSSAEIIKRLIELAGKVGGKDDLDWLVEKAFSGGSESSAAWQVMLKIFKESDESVIRNWVSRLETEPAKTKLSDEQMILFLEIAEKKFLSSEGAEKILNNVRSKLKDLSRKTGNYKQAARVLIDLRKSALNVREKTALGEELLEVYLRLPDIRLAASLVGEYLEEKDIEAGGSVVGSITEFLSSPPNGTDPNELLQEFTKMKVTGRPMWDQQLKQWTKQFAKKKVSDSNTPG